MRYFGYISRFEQFVQSCKVSKDYTQWQLFAAMQKMLLPTPDDRFNKFRKSVGKFQDDFRRQPNFEEDFLSKPCTYFLNVFDIETQN